MDSKIGPSDSAAEGGQQPESGAAPRATAATTVPTATATEPENPVVSDQKEVLFGSFGSMPYEGEFTPGSVALVSLTELKAQPFMGESRVTINGAMFNYDGSARGMDIGGAGELRLQAHGSEKVWNVVYRYGFVISGPGTAIVDGTEYNFL